MKIESKHNGGEEKGGKGEDAPGQESEADADLYDAGLEISFNVKLSTFHAANKVSLAIYYDEYEPRAAGTNLLNSTDRYLPLLCCYSLRVYTDPFNLLSIYIDPLNLLR